jgi:hypothetical protein
MQNGEFKILNDCDDLEFFKVQAKQTSSLQINLKTGQGCKKIQSNPKPHMKQKRQSQRCTAKVSTRQRRPLTGLDARMAEKSSWCWVMKMTSATRLSTYRKPHQQMA